MNNINNKLNILYSSKIKMLPVDFLTKEKLDGPCLMYCWEEDYLHPDSKKILIIGQENDGWWGDICTDVNILMNYYKEFELAKKYNTVFWRYAYYFINQVNPNCKNMKNFLWTNVSKFCTIQGSRLSMNQHLTSINYFNVLIEEIKILSPDIVLFFSGPFYDDKIKCQFDETLTFEKVFDDIPRRELAILKHSKLPMHTYRTYHPKALNIQKKKNYLDRIVKIINGFE